MSELRRIVDLLDKISELEKYKKMWERFWYEFDNVYNLIEKNKKSDFREQLLYRKTIIEKEIKK